MLRASDIVFTGHYREEREDRPEFMVLADGHRWFMEQVTDRYSLPSWLRWWQPTDVRFWGPSLGHDIRLEIGIEPRRRIDQDFHIDMRRLGIEKRYRWPAYWGVRIGSWSGYKAPAPVNRRLVQDIRNAWPHVDEWRLDTLRARTDRTVERLNHMRVRWGLDTFDTIQEYRDFAETEPKEFLFTSKLQEPHAE